MKEDRRKGKIITIIGEDLKKRIPRCMDTIFKIKMIPVTDNEDIEKDETFRLHTLQTIDVEGVTVVDGGRAVNVNGDFDISLLPSDDEDDKDLLNKVWADKNEAISAWKYLTKLQLDRAETMKTKIDNTVITIRTSLEECQY